MKGRWRILTVRDVPVHLHWTFLVLVGLLGVAVYSESASLRTTGYALGMILLVFLFVLLHEMAHVATARRFGVPTREITLHPLGGVSMMERMPEAPGQEAAVSAAGPAVNLVLALLLVPFVWHYHGVEALWEFRFLRLDRLSLVRDLYWLNIVMGVFNLLPAFPLDGGRVLRSSLATRFSHARATRMAANTGRLFGILFAIAGLFWPNLFLILIGIFVYFGASAEQRSAQAMAVFAGHEVHEAMRTDHRPVRPDTPLDGLRAFAYQTGQSDLVVEEHGSLAGIVDRQTLAEAAPAEARTVADIMRTDVPRLHPDDDLQQAFRHFLGGRLKMIPVTERAWVPAGPQTAQPKQRISWAKVPIDKGHGRVVGVVSVEDLERSFRHFAGIDPTAGARPAPTLTLGGRGRAPRATETRVRREEGDDAEVWVPVLRE